MFIIQAASYHCHTKAARHTCLSKSRTLEVPTQARQLNVLGNNTDDSATKWWRRARFFTFCVDDWHTPTAKLESLMYIWTIPPNCSSWPRPLFKEEHRGGGGTWSTLLGHCCPYGCMQTQTCVFLNVVGRISRPGQKAVVNTSRWVLRVLVCTAKGVPMI